MNSCMCFTSFLAIIFFKFCFLNADRSNAFRYNKHKRIRAPAILDERPTRDIFECTRACKSKVECKSVQFIHRDGDTICQLLADFIENKTLVDDPSSDLIGKIDTSCANGGYWNSTLHKCENCTHGFVGQFCNRRIMDCKEGTENGYTGTKLMLIQPIGAVEPVLVKCDFVSSRTYIDSRGYCGPRENFTRNWFDYKRGFGDPNCDHFIGLENIHLLTKQRDATLRIEMRENGVNHICLYGGFSLDGENNKYALRYDSFMSSSLADGFDLVFPPCSARDSPFCTVDNDCGSCAQISKSGWWCSAVCSEVNFHKPPTAEYLNWPDKTEELFAMQRYYFSLF